MKTHFSPFLVFLVAEVKKVLESFSYQPTSFTTTLMLRAAIYAKDVDAGVAAASASNDAIDYSNTDVRHWVPKLIKQAHELKQSYVIQKDHIID